MNSGKRYGLLSLIAMLSSIALIVAMIPAISEAVRTIDYQVYRRLLTMVLVLSGLSAVGLITGIIAVVLKARSVVISWCFAFHFSLFTTLLIVLGYLLCPFVHRLVMFGLKNCFP